MRIESYELKNPTVVQRERNLQIIHEGDVQNCLWAVHRYNEIETGDLPYVCVNQGET